MKKIIIFLLCYGVLIGMVGCGGNTASPSTESSNSIALEISMTETPHTSAVEPTQKEKETVSIKSQEQTSEPTSTAPMTTKTPTEEIKNSEITNTSEENGTSQTVEATSNITLQHTKSERTVTESTEETAPETETIPSAFDIQYLITFAKEYSVSIGLVLDGTAVDCWDNPIRAGAHCIYIERDIISRLNRYARDEDITDIWIWTESVGNDCYDIYIGYA